MALAHVPLILFGVGGVGQTLLRQIIDSRDLLARRLNLHLSVVGLVTRQHELFHPAGLDDERLLALLERSETGQPPSRQGWQVRTDDQGSLRTHVPALGEPPVVIDATAAEGMENVLLTALDLGCRVALANSRALVGPWSVSHRFFQEPNVRFEATVGAGLPATRTLRGLLNTGDRVSAIEGALSGTASYICSQLQLDVPFSVTLAQARDLGYTEPDPREDLSGQDSARKILVMSRLAGWPLEMNDVQIEQLCSPLLSSMPFDRFIEQAARLDDNVARRVQAAREDGCVLRYVAETDPGGGRVGLRAVPRVSQLGVIQGPECLLTLFTARYTVSPLTISGRGVGPELAATALLNDIVYLARSNSSQLPAR